MARSTALSRLVDRAALPYRPMGKFVWLAARGKLSGDPVFTALLRLGLLPPQARILDLGCGQGLLGAWLNAAVGQFADGDWPDGWPAPCRPTSLRGIELSGRDAARARQALGDAATIVQGDIQTTAFGNADVVVITDVLQYISHTAQDEVLARVRGALPPGGMLLLRVGDASGGLWFRLGTLADLLVMRARGYAATSLHCRTLTEWTMLLRRLDFTVEARAMSKGTPFANTLLVCKL